MVKTRNLSEDSGLTPAQERTLVALLSTPNHEMAAKQAGITSRTLRKYLRTPEFRTEYQTRRREMLASAIALAQQYAVDMAAVQISLAKDTNISPSVRVTAANNIFGIAMSGTQEDLLERIERLEEMFAEQSVVTNGHRKRTHSPY
jgi:hypothetical protein